MQRTGSKRKREVSAADSLVAESAAASLPKPSRALHLLLAWNHGEPELLCEVTRDSERLRVLSEVLSMIGIPQKRHSEGKLDEIWFKLGRQFKKRNHIFAVASVWIDTVMFIIVGKKWPLLVGLTIMSYNLGRL